LEEQLKSKDQALEEAKILLEKKEVTVKKLTESKKLLNRMIINNNQTVGGSLDEQITNGFDLLRTKILNLVHAQLLQPSFSHKQSMRVSRDTRLISLQEDVMNGLRKYEASRELQKLWFSGFIAKNLYYGYFYQRRTFGVDYDSKLEKYLKDFECALEKELSGSLLFFVF